MGNTKDTGFLRNLISYDASGNIVLPANLTVTGSLLTNGGGSYATQSYVTTQISNLVNAAPGALDTLNELATALGNDANFSTTVTNSIATKLALSGGTLTGALSGTSATFSGLLTLTSGGGTKAIFQTTRSFGVNRNFQISVDEYQEGQFAITPSTTLGGSGYTTPIFTLAASGAATFSSSIAATSLSINTSTTDGRIDVRPNGLSSFPIYWRNNNGGYGGGVYVTGGNNMQLYLTTSIGTENVLIAASGNSWLNGGNLGIGTIAPQYSIDVNGVIRSKNSSSVGDVYLGSTPAGVGYAAAAIKGAQSPSYSYTGKLSLYVTTWGANTDYGLTEQMYIETSSADNKNAKIVMAPWGGNVGMGTTNPLRTLHVMGQAAFDMTSTGVVIQSNGTVSEIVSYKQTGSTYADLHLRGATLGIVINGSNGKVGIGTASPSYNLSVASYLGVGAQGGGDIVLIGGGSGVGAFIQLRYADGNTNVHLAGNGNSYLNAYYGNTGVGTTNPASTLSVQGEIAKYCTTSGVDGNFQNLIKYGYSSDLQSGNSNANRWLGIDATVTAGAAVTNTLRIRAYGGGSGNAAPVNVVDFRGDQSSVFYSYIRHNTRVFSGNSYVGNLSPNLNTAYSRNYLLVCDLNNIAGFSLSGHMNAASYTCWNMSNFWIMKNYSSTNGSAGITGMYKGGGCDMNIVDLNYAGGRYIAIGYTSNPEVNGMWIGYRVNHLLNADGSAIVVPDSSVSINSTYATY